MVVLRDLHRAIVAAVEAGGGQKIYFYASDADGFGIRHGFVAIPERASACEVSFEGMDADSALEEIPRLSFIKVHSLKIVGGATAPGAQTRAELEHVITLLDPDLRPRRVPPPAPPAVAPAAPAVPAVPTLAKAPIQLAHIQLERRATDLLRQLFGTSASEKVLAISSKHPPITHSFEFIGQCEHLAAMIVGAGKARQLFQPLRDGVVE